MKNEKQSEDEQQNPNMNKNSKSKNKTLDPKNEPSEILKCHMSILSKSTLPFEKENEKNFFFINGLICIFRRSI